MTDDDTLSALAYHEQLLQQEQEMSDCEVSFFTALAPAKLEFPVLRRNKVVKVRTKAGGEYKFAYAPLEEILRVEAPLLKHGFSLSQSEVVKDGVAYVHTVLAHKDGHSISGDTKILTMEQGPQAYGSALTYARRYGITLLLCLATDEDDDGNAAEGNTATKTNGDRSGRPDTSKVDADMADEYAQRMWDIVQAGDRDRATKLHWELNQDEALYTAATDIYRGICKSNKFSYGGEKWKDLLDLKTKAA
jgi:hypothetical protein